MTQRDLFPPPDMKNLDLFTDQPPEEPDPSPAPGRRRLMHVSDAGEREDGQLICTMTCRKCGAESGWLPFATKTQAKRGIPCETCNTVKPA